jgi:hypothetical protein
MSAGASGRSLPLWGRVGVGLVAVTWPLNWLLTGTRTHLLFFPLWLGYVLAVDGWVLARTGSSPLMRSWRGCLVMFGVSALVWWMFEAINRRLQNWEYVGREVFSDFEYAFYCSLSFSTVMPAVLTTAELWRSTRWIERFATGPRLVPTRRFEVCVLAAGVAMFAAMMAWPRVFYVFCWTSLVFLIEPICRWVGRPSFTEQLARRDWRPWFSLWAGGLTCGFFWELWNIYSDPKWVYHVPGVGFWKVFEMPILGYLGYFPFAMELFLLAQLLVPRAARPRL